MRVMASWDNLDLKGPQEISSPTFFSHRVSMGSDQGAQCVVQLHSEILNDGDDSFSEQLAPLAGCAHGGTFSH